MMKREQEERAEKEPPQISSYDSTIQSFLSQNQEGSFNFNIFLRTMKVLNDEEDDDDDTNDDDDGFGDNRVRKQMDYPEHDQEKEFSYINFLKLKLSHQNQSSQPSQNQIIEKEWLIDFEKNQIETSEDQQKDLKTPRLINSIGTTKTEEKETEGWNHHEGEEEEEIPDFGKNVLFQSDYRWEKEELKKKSLQVDNFMDDFEDENDGFSAYIPSFMPSIITKKTEPIQFETLQIDDLEGEEDEYSEKMIIKNLVKDHDHDKAVEEIETLEFDDDDEEEHNREEEEEAEERKDSSSMMTFLLQLMKSQNHHRTQQICEEYLHHHHHHHHHQGKKQGDQEEELEEQLFTNHRHFTEVEEFFLEADEEQK